jgi:L-alanine-DL-glutamate epimerase-like enolase superfamily enzyme
VYASRLYSQKLEDLAAEAQRYKDEGYSAMKMRFGWGPIDGAAGMQRNIELVKTVREVIGYEIDLMADAYRVGRWTMHADGEADRAVSARWLEEPVIADDVEGYAASKSLGRVPIAGGEHEFTIYGFRRLLEAQAVDYDTV